MGEHGARLKLAISAPAVDGKANQALTEFLAKILGVPKLYISIVRGTKARQKSSIIKDVSGAVGRRLLDAFRNSG